MVIDYFLNSVTFQILNDDPHTLAVDGILTENLVKIFQDITALNGLNIELNQGTIVGLLGPNGAGKSTLIRLLSGVMKPTSGNASLYGFDLLKDTNEVKRITGLLPEEYALYEKLSVFEYLQFISALYDVPSEVFEKRVFDYANRLEVNDLIDRLIETLSKGQKQKVALMASLIHEPQVLFLDEPLANLDVKAQREVKQIILEYKRQNRIIVIATHLLDNVKHICDEILLITQGVIRFQGTIEEFQGNAINLEEAYLQMLVD